VIRHPDVSKWAEGARDMQKLLEGSDNYNKSLLFDQICEVLLRVWIGGWLSIALIRRSSLSRPLTIL
jgi:hypothetical protein